MAKFLHITRKSFEKDQKSDPNNKPRVYFTCHPDDFKECFSKICADIFLTHDCAIYYTEDMTEKIEETDKHDVFGRMNLFVVPVTLKLLTKPCRAMDDDLDYAKKHGIPILPIVMELGVEKIYEKSKKFDNRQFLNAKSTDSTEVNYAAKLEKHLDLVLIGEELANRIRAAFDAYIFLSYRKKDRRYANELMSLIHKIPEYRDIAIWYDEFLEPGEVFTESIERALKNSKLFALLVTPNLLEEPDGKKNYVMDKEYPMARDAKMEIFPAEMENTDYDKLRDKFIDIPKCISVEDKEAFKKHLLKLLTDIATSKSEKSAEHNFLIGLAYLEGIDVEVNRNLGFELILLAAEAEVYEAMKKVVYLYHERYGYFCDDVEAVKWSTRLVDYCKKEFGECSQETFDALSSMSAAYLAIGERDRSIELEKEIYDIKCRELGEDHADSISSLCELVSFELWLYGDEHEEKLYNQLIDPKCKINSDVFAKINRIVQTCDEMEFCSSSLKWAKLNYDLKCRYSDKTDVESLKLLGAVASAYQSNDKKDEAIKTQQEVCDKYKELLGESDVETILANVTLGSIYAKNKRYNEAQPILDDCYEKLCKYVGEHNFETVEVLYKLGCANRRIENYSLAKKQLLYVYEWRRVHLGQNEEDTVFALDELAYSCLKNKDYDDSESYYVQLCDLIYDEDRKSYVVNFKDPDDVWHWDFVLADALGYLTDIYLEKKDYKNALKCQKRLKPIVDGLYMFEDNGEPQKVEAKIKEINTLMEATRGET